MSMKRTKQSKAPSARGSASSSRTASKAKEVVKTWAQWTEGQPDSAFVTYNMKERYGKGQLLSHATFGRGAVVAAHDSLVEVIFADGQRRLGHGIA